MSHTHHHHSHSHPHPHAEGEGAHLPRWRLLAMSAGNRLLLALIPICLLWLMVGWALGGEA